MSGLHLPLPELQIAFFQKLEQIRRVHLQTALFEAVGESDISTLDAQLKKIASTHALRKLASWGLRGEVLFAVPSLLSAHPQLLGYYRLLLGYSQKEFYSRNSGIGKFKSMETAGRVSALQSRGLEALCRALADASEYLISETGQLSSLNVHELTLLTVGPQFRGGALNLIGERANRKVFELIKATVKNSIVRSERRFIELRNAAGRTVRVAFSADPDIAVAEVLGSGQKRYLVAIEVKGGRDVSNVHNRIGEAEKSHLKAKQKGYIECWTVLGVAGLDLAVARQESRTTDRFYFLDDLVGKEPAQAQDFKDYFRAIVSIDDR